MGTVSVKDTRAGLSRCRREGFVMAPRDNDSGNGFNDTFIPWVAGEPLPARDSGGKKTRGKARGRHPHNKLTVLTMRRLGPGRHSDGEGLYLFVLHTTS